MKLLLDHHYSAAIGEHLRKCGHDVQTAFERGWQTENDEMLLLLCASEQRSLLTNNVTDFDVIARRWAVSGQRHFGVIFTSDRSLPRERDFIGAYASKLDALMRAHPAESDLMDQILWLT